jgi:hypothetical protein
MASECSVALHGYPLPPGYTDAADAAHDRLRQGWQNIRCPLCGFYGWQPPTEAVTPDGK